LPKPEKLPERVNIATNPPRAFRRPEDPRRFVKADAAEPTDSVHRSIVSTRSEIEDILHYSRARHQNSVQFARRDPNASIKRRKPVKLEPGKKQNYLESLRSAINEERTSELASSMPFISLDLLGLISSQSAVISSSALQILRDLLPVYPLHFKSILPALVEGVIGQTELGNPRSAATAALVLADFQKTFDGGGFCRSASTSRLRFPY
jgi:hypothetical protein